MKVKDKKAKKGKLDNKRMLLYKNKIKKSIN